MVQLLEAIDPSTLIGKRDRAMIGTMAYSFAPVSYTHLTLPTSDLV